MKNTEIRAQICDICYKMWQLGWVAANDGNVSVKLGDDRFLATPTGMSKAFITPEKLLLINGRGEIVEAQEGLRPPAKSRCICAVTPSVRTSARSSTLIRRGRPALPWPISPWICTT